MPEIVEALYNFQPQSAEDMALSPGQRIEVQQHLSSDWARGKNLSTGQVGVFPKNYVKPVEEQERDFSRPAAPIPSNNSDSPRPFDEKQQYQPPAASWQSQGPPQYQPPQQHQQYQAPQLYQPPQQQYYPPPQQYQQYQPPVQQQQPQQQEQHAGRRHTGLGNLARRFGDSVMFGAGATLGSDLIHKIF